MILNFVGDIMLGRSVGETIKGKGSKFVFENIIPIIPEADGMIANLEAPFATEGRTIANKDPHLTFKIDPELVSILKYLKITSVTLANNHIGDYGISAIKATRDVLDRNNISYTGAGSHLSEAIEPIVFVDKKTQESISILSFNAFVPFTKTASNKKFGVSRFDYTTLRIAITKTLSKSNSIIISVHWGIDYHQYPIPQLVHFATKLMDEFPEIIAVVGHHPHLQQPTIYHKGRPIFCSLGNFIFDEPFPLSRIGSILTLEIENGTIKKHKTLFTKLGQDFKMSPLTHKEADSEISRLNIITEKMKTNSIEYKKMDKKWIRYLIYQTIRYRSLNDLSYLIRHYSLSQIIKSIIIK